MKLEYHKKFSKFSMILEFHELEYHKKLDFTKLEYSKSGKSLYISKIVVDCNMFAKICYLTIFAAYSVFNTRLKFRN